MSKQEEFTLNIAKLENERLLLYTSEMYLNKEFHLDIKDESISTKIYHKIQELWSQGLLELFIKNNILRDKLEVKDLVAFDSARFTKLVLEVLKLKLMDEKEAWGLLFLNAARVQDVFENAEDFKASYFKGALFYDILFKSEEENIGDKIEDFDALFKELHKASQIEILWLEEDIFKALKIEESTSSIVSSQVMEEDIEPKIILTHRLLEKEDKTELWELLENFSHEERNKFLNELYLKQKHITAEDYLELPALYTDVSYAHYLRGVYFYNFAWEARGLGITNTVGQKNYALFYERLRYAMKDLKKAYELSPNEQTYWAELYNLVKHFNSIEADSIQAELYALIKKDAMQNEFCIKRVSHLNKARWGGSHEESLNWAREVIEHSQKGDSIRVIIFEVLIEQYNYILEFDRDEKSANAIFEDEDLQEEVNQYFEELLNNSQEITATIVFWYEKVGDKERLKKLF